MDFNYGLLEIINIFIKKKINILKLWKREFENNEGKEKKWRGGKNKNQTHGTHKDILLKILDEKIVRFNFSRKKIFWKNQPPQKKN